MHFSIKEVFKAVQYCNQMSANIGCVAGAHNFLYHNHVRNWCIRNDDTADTCRYKLPKIA